jgi:hypothetical protein
LLWQALLEAFQPAFSHRGWQRFGQWTTGIVLNVEEHTITQSLIALDRPQDWKALEAFAELGAWDQPLLTQRFAQLLDAAPGSLWHGYRVSALDDTKVHRNSANVWGTCTFHEYTARCPNRATTVRAHNWVVLGRLLEYPNHPAWFLPHTGRLYFRKSQLPTHPIVETFHTKCELAVALVQEHAASVPAAHLAVFDGGFAFASVVRPLVQPPAGKPRIDFLTRLRTDARLHALPPPPAPDGKKPRGRPPKWGKRLPPPRQGGWWPGQWHEGTAFIYGRQRKVRWKEVLCQWRVCGHETPVKAIVAEVEGYSERFCLVTSALRLTGLQMVELFAARFRQEDGFRDLKQRLGWEECRAWTKLPIERTTQVLFCAMSLLRLLQFRLDQEGQAGGDWWQAPPWNPRKDRPSVLDVERLFRKHAGEIRQLLSAWLAEGEKQAG